MPCCAEADLPARLAARRTLMGGIDFARMIEVVREARRLGQKP